MFIGYVGIYSYTGGSWSLQQTLTGSSTDSDFSISFAFSSTSTQNFLAVGASGYDSYTGMWLIVGVLM